MHTFLYYYTFNNSLDFSLFEVEGVSNLIGSFDSIFEIYMNLIMRKPTFWFSTWSDTNQAVKLQKMARGLKFLIKKVHVEGLYYLSGENKGADQLRGNLSASLFSHMQNVGFLMTQLIL